MREEGEGMIAGSRILMLFGAIGTILTGCSRHPADDQSPILSMRATNSPRIGDKAVYSFKASMARQGVGSGIDVSGSAVYKMETARDDTGAKAPFLVRCFNLVQHQEQIRMGRGQSNTLIVRLGEDTAGNLYLLGKLREGKRWDFVTDTKPPLCMPAEIGSESAWQYTAHYASGSVESVAYSCLGSERVKTPAGEYNAYKLRVSMTFSQKPGATGYVWISPDLPHVFELRSELSSAGQDKAISQRTRIVTILESVERGR